MMDKPKHILHAFVKAVWLVPDYGTEPIKMDKKCMVTSKGLYGDKHETDVRILRGFEKHVGPKGMKVRNYRQITIVSSAELSFIRLRLRKLGFDVPDVLSEDLLANIELEGITYLSQLPGGTLLRFPEAILEVSGINIPCIIPGERMEKRLGCEDSGLASAFPKAALHQRGVFATAFSDIGFIQQGDPVTIELRTDKIIV